MTNVSKTTPHPAIKQIIVLGHSGFVGRRVKELLEERYPGLKVTGITTRDIDLTVLGAGERLGELFDAETALIMCSGIKSNYGTNLENYVKNVAMAENVCRALAQRTVYRLLFLSSIAVYGVDRNDVNITERTEITPDTYYGLSKFVSESLLQLQCAPSGPSGLIVLRIPSVYGPHERIIAPTPSGFLTTCRSGGEVMLWGDGSELREFLFIDDLVGVIDLLLQTSFTGVLNVSSGIPVSYQQAMNVISGLLTTDVVIHRRERTKPKVDKVYDTSLLRSLIPQFRYTSLDEGLRLIQQTSPRRL